MAAERILYQKDSFPDGTISEMVIWRLRHPVPGSRHTYKYRFFFGRAGQRLIGYDNERGKGDHRHIEGREEPYAFSDLGQLVEDYWAEVERWRDDHPDADR